MRTRCLTGASKTAESMRDVVTVMTMCGMYNAAGEWAYDVGIPAKSGVSGGILIAVPNYFGGAFFSPGLDVYGNSVRGVNICRDLSSRFGLHLFADPDEAMFGRMEPVGPHPASPALRTETPARRRRCP